MSDGFENSPLFEMSPEETSNPYAAPADSWSVAVGPDGELATRSARFAGAVVDMLLMLPLVFVFIPVSLMIEGAFSGNALTAELVTDAVGVLATVVLHLLINGYTLAKYGQSLGKMAAGTKIVDATTGEIPPLKTLILKRYASIQLIACIPIVGSFFGLVDPLMIFRENRRCLHDDIAGTKVISVR